MIINLWNKLTSKFSSKKTTKTNEIAIIGMACRFPDAKNYKAFWQNLTNGRQSIKEIPPSRWSSSFYSKNFSDENKSISKWGGLLEGIDLFDNQFFNISPREAKNMDPQQRILLEESWHCLEDSAISLDTLQKSKTGVFVGVMATDYTQVLIGENVPADAYACLGNYECILANRISYFLGLSGKSIAIDTACSSSLVSLNEAAQSIKSGESDYAFAAGVCLICHPWKYIVFSKSRMLSPEGLCKTFDKDANGYVPGEGVGVLLLTTLENALKQGCHIYGLLKGSAVNHCGHPISITAPNVNAQADVIRMAQRNANITAESVSYLEAHGTGTSLGDPIEIEGLKQAFATEKKQFCGIGSVKTNIGHLEGAAGVAGVIKVLLMFKYNVIPPTLNIKTINPIIDFENSPFKPITQLIPWNSENNTLRRAGVSSFGFGGVNAHVILEEYKDCQAAKEKYKTQRKSHPMPFILSAKTEGSLVNLIKEWKKFVRGEEFKKLNFQDICFSLYGRNAFSYRCGKVLHSKKEIKSFIKTFSTNEIKGNIQNYRWMLVIPDLQEVNFTYDLFYELFKKNPLVNKAIDDCNKILYSLKKRNWTKNKKLSSFVITYSLSSLLIDSGVNPATIAGEKNGFLIAAVLTGLMTLQDAIAYFVNSSNIPNLKRPHYSYYDLSAQKEIYPNHISSKFLKTLETEIKINQYKLNILLQKAKILKESQHTFKRYIDEWKEPLATINLSPDELFSIDLKQSDIKDKKLITLTIMLLTSFQQLNKKWNLSILNEESEDLEFMSFIISESIISIKEFIHWLFNNDEKQNKHIAKLINHQNINSNFLNKFLIVQNSKLHEVKNKRNWLEKSANTKLLFQEKAWKMPVQEFKTFYEGLLELWLKNVNINWKLILPVDSQNYKVSLPLYVFDKREFWYNSSVIQVERYKKDKPSPPLPQLSYSGNEVQLEIFQDQIAIIKMIDQKNKNLLTKELMHGLEAKIKEAQANPKIKVVILTGYNNIFCMGGDKESLLAISKNKMKFTDMPFIYKGLLECELPVITAIQGHAHGGGFVFGLYADIIIISEENTYSASFMKYGFTPGVGATFILKEKLGNIATEMMLTANLFTGSELQKRAVSVIVRKQDQVLKEALSIALSLAEKPRNALKILKQEMAKKILDRLPDILNSELIMHEKTFSCSEVTEKIQAEFKGFADNASNINNQNYQEPPAITIPQNNIAQDKNTNNKAINLNEINREVIHPISPADIQNKLVQITAEVLHCAANDLSSQTSFKDLGADSIAAIEIIRLVNNEFALNLQSANVYGYPNIESLSLYIAKKLKELNTMASLVSESTKPETNTQHNPVNFNKINLLSSVPDKKSSSDSSIEKANDKSDINAIQNKLILITSDVLHCSANDLSPQTSFNDLGADSIAAIEIIRLVNSEFTLNLQAANLYGYPNIESLSLYIAKKLKELNTAITIISDANKLELAKQGSNINSSNDLKYNDSILVNQTTNAIINSSNETSFNKIVLSSVTPIKSNEDLLKKKYENLVNNIETNHDDIAVIGMSGVFPDAENLAKFWDNLKNGIDSIKEIPKDRWAVDAYYDPNPHAFNKTYSRVGTFIKDVASFDPLFFNISPREAEIMDPQQRLFLQEAWKALEDAGYTKENISNVKCGVFVGTNVSDYYDLLSKENLVNTADAFIGLSSSILASRISYYLNLKGPSIAIDTACSSSLVAIHEACESIISGQCEMALAGGIALMLTPKLHILTAKAGMLSPTQTCRTFDNAANGIVLGEGVGLIVLKKLKQALQDRDIIYGIIKASGINQDGTTNGITAPNPESQTDLELAVYKKANINPENISYVEAHGTGTKLGDPIEISALTNAFRHYTDKKQYCALGSVKTNIGHTTMAAGVASVIKVLLAMKYKFIPPHLHFQNPNEQLQLDETPFYINTELKEWTINSGTARYAVVSSFGYSGTNSHVLIEEPPEQHIVENNIKPFYLLTLSAKTESCLMQKIEDLIAWLDNANNQNFPLSAIAYTLNVARNHFNYRFAMVVDSKDTLSSLLVKARRKEESEYYFFGKPEKNTVKIDYKTAFDENIAKLKNILSDKKTEYKNSLLMLAKIYINGYHFNFELLHEKEIRQKISLPTYPFAKEYYWIPENNKNKDNVQKTASLHPLIDTKLPTLEGHHFKKILTGNEFYLTDHRVQEIPILPGVAYLEMAYSAAKLANYQNIIAIKNVTWSQPLFVKNQPVELEIVLQPEDTKILTFKIITKDTLHAQGKIIFGDNDNIKNYDPIHLSSIKNNCKTEKIKEDIYTKFNQLGINYGPHFQGIQKLWVGDNEALAEIKLSDPLLENIKSFYLHPGLMDSILQTVIAMDQESILYLPFSLGELNIIAPLPKHLYAYVNKNTNSDTIKRFNINIVDAQGAPVIFIKDFSVRPYQSSENEIFYFHPIWKPQESKLQNQTIPYVLFEATGHIQTDFANLLKISKELINNKPNETQQLICILQSNIYYFEAISAFMKTLHLEFPKIIGRVIQIKEKTDLEAELNTTELEVRYDDNHQRLVKTYTENNNNLTDKLPLKQNGVYWITGGTGGLGLIFANYLSNKYKAKIILTARSPLNENINEKLTKLGNEAIYLSGEISNKEEVKRIYQSIKNHFGTINGIIHSAGSIHDAFIAKKTLEQAQTVLAPKIDGLLYLDEITQHEPLDFFVVFSSLASVFGNIGQCDYAFANGFMNDYVVHRETLRKANQRNGKSIAINWPLWKEGGMKIDEASYQWLKNTLGADSITTEEGISAFTKLLQQSYNQSLVVSGNKEKLKSHLSRLKEIEQKNVTTPVAHNQTQLSEKVRTQLVSIISDLLKIKSENLDIYTDFSEYGVDSITLTALANQVNIFYKLEITPAILFEYKTLSEFSEYLLKEHHDAILNTYPDLSVTDQNKPNTTPILIQPQVKSQNSSHEVLDTKIVNPEKTKIQDTDIAIIGMSGIFPGSPNLTHFWQHIEKQDDLITEIPKERWDWESFYSEGDNNTKIKWGGFIEDIDRFDAGFFNISPKEAELMDPQQRIFLETVWNTIENAGYKPTDLAKVKTGLFVGVSTSDYAELVHAAKETSAHVPTGIGHSVLANRVSFLLNLNGPSEAIDTACSSSLVAIHNAIKAIQTGDCDIAIAGGVNALISPTNFLAFSKAGMLSADGRCKTFDKKANGYVRGEGVGAILLKPLSKALADQNIIYGVIKSSAVNHGGHVTSLTVPNPNAQASLIISALQKANIDPKEVSYIEAHGTGTPLGDPIEVNGLKKAFSQLNNNLPSHYCGLGTVKTNIGHLESAAGIASIIKVLLCLQHNKLPGNVHFQELNPYIEIKNSPFYIVENTKEWSPIDKGTRRIAGISSFGFGGANAHVIIEEPPKQENEIIEKIVKPYYLITLSAKTEESLYQRMSDLSEWINLNNNNNSLSAIAYTLNVKRCHFDYRAAFVVNSIDMLKEQLSKAREKVNAEFYICGKVNKNIEDAILYKKILKQTINELNLEAADYSENLLTLANLYVKGYEIDWDLLHEGESKKYISLPTYPFAKERYWISNNPILNNTTSSGDLLLSKDVISYETILNFILSKLALLTKKPVKDLDIHEEISRYGLDSFIIAEMAKELERTFGKKDNTAIFFSAKNIEDLAKRIHDQYKNHIPSIYDTYGNKINSDTILIQKEDIAIIGIAGRYAQADNLYCFYENLKAGKDSIVEIPPDRWDYSQLGTKENPIFNQAKWGSFINNVESFDHEHFKISYNEALRVHPEERLLLEEAWHCFESAGYNPLEWLKDKNNNIGVYIGASFHDYQYLLMEANQNQQTELPCTSQINTYANRLSYFFNLTGPSVAVDTACSSSLFAIYEAFHAIRDGRCTMALAGGVNLSLHPSKYILLSQLSFMAKDGKCHAFTEGGSGYVPGEGVGLVLLKKLSDAVRDHDNILAVIKSAASGNDGKTNGFTVPDPDAQRQVITRALNDSQISPSTINLIECHGTGTPLGDPIEVAALTEVFAKDSPKKQYCAISSVKSNIGHLEAAAGIAQITKVILQLQSKQLFPNVMHNLTLNRHIHFSETPFYVQDNLMPWKQIADLPRRAGISSFGAGGTNVHLVLEEYLQPSVLKSSDQLSYVLIPFSADTEIQLIKAIKEVYQFLAEKRYQIFNNSYSVIDIAGTLQQGRAERKCRLALVCANDFETLLTEIKNIITYYDQHNHFAINKSIFFKKLDPGFKPTPSENIAEINSIDDLEGKLKAFADRWVNGQTINWNHISKDYYKVFLPGYSFKHITINLPKKNLAVPEATKAESKKVIESEILKTVTAVFKKVLGALPDNFSENDDFADLGIDSIVGSRIHAELSKYYSGLDIFALFEHNNFKQLVSYIYLNAKASTKPVASKEIKNQEDSKLIGLVSEEKYQQIDSNLISMEEFVHYYNADGGKVNILIEKVALANGAFLEILSCGEGEPVIFLPPFNTTAIIWVNQIIYLSKYFKIIVIHYPGIAGSDWIENLSTFSSLAKIIIEVIDILRNKKTIDLIPVAVVGWSFGGFLAQTLAVEYPDYFSKLILISTTTISWSSKEYNISGEEFSAHSAQQFRENYEKIPNFIKKIPKVKHLLEQNSIEAFVLGSTNIKVISTYFRMIAKFRHLDFANKIKTKSYLISGTEDNLMPVKFARELHSLIPGSEYYEVKTGQHFMALFNKTIINKKLLEWLSRSE